jgi:hypothetical protein
MISVSATPYKRAPKVLTKLQDIINKFQFSKYGQMGVDALAKNTPKDSGLTAESWRYKIDSTNTQVTITWYNTNHNDGVCVAIILQYGHGTGTGGYVQGTDYINPAIKPIFDDISKSVKKEVQTIL